MKFGNQASNVVKHITTNTTTVVMTGPGFLDRIIVNSKGATANIATVFDGVDNTGAVLAVLDTVATLGSIPYGIPVVIGICVVTSAGTAADLTVGGTLI